MLERLVVAKEEALVGGHRFDHLADQRFGRRCAQTISKCCEVAQLLAFQDGSEPCFQQV